MQLIFSGKESHFTAQCIHVFYYVEDVNAERTACQEFAASVVVTTLVSGCVCSVLRAAVHDARVVNFVTHTSRLLIVLRHYI